MIADLPLKINEGAIVIMKGVPLFQCNSCSEYVMDCNVMKHVDEILEKVDAETELEVIEYAE